MRNACAVDEWDAINVADRKLKKPLPTYCGVKVDAPKWVMLPVGHYRRVVTPDQHIYCDNWDPCPCGILRRAPVRSIWVPRSPTDSRSSTDELDHHGSLSTERAASAKWRQRWSSTDESDATIEAIVRNHSDKSRQTESIITDVSEYQTKHLERETDSIVVLPAEHNLSSQSSQRSPSRSPRHSLISNMDDGLSTQSRTSTFGSPQKIVVQLGGLRDLCDGPNITVFCVAVFDNHPLEQFINQPRNRTGLLQSKSKRGQRIITMRKQLVLNLPPGAKTLQVYFLTCDQEVFTESGSPTQLWCTNELGRIHISIEELTSHCRLVDWENINLHRVESNAKNLNGSVAVRLLSLPLSVGPSASTWNPPIMLRNGGHPDVPIQRSGMNKRYLATIDPTMEISTVKMTTPKTDSPLKELPIKVRVTTKQSDGNNIPQGVTPGMTTRVNFENDIIRLSSTLTNAAHDTTNNPQETN